MAESADPAPSSAPDGRERPYGDLSRLNTSRLILDAVGPDALRSIAEEFLDELGSSAAVYERNGDYALGIISSGWCRVLDEASYRLCRTDDPQTALESGAWLCHEACWRDASRLSIERDEPVDVKCPGGIHLFAAPIRADGEPVGSIDVGYGDPPDDPSALAELAEKFGVPVERLRAAAREHPRTTPEAIEDAKRKLLNAARLIGLMVERHLAQREAREAGDRYRLLFETMGQGVLFFDDQIVVVESNPAACRILGRTPEEIRDQTRGRDAEILDSEGRPLPIERVPAVRALQENRRIVETLGVRNPVDGRIHWLRGEVVPLVDEGETRPRGLYSLFSDVTEEREAAEALQKSEAFNRRIAEVMPSILYVFDLRARRNVFVNREVGEVLGYSRDEFLNEGVEFLRKVMHPGDVPRLEEHLRRLEDLEDGQILGFEYRVRTADGEWRWHLSRDSVFERDGEGGSVRIIGTATDITERRRAEEGLRESEERLRLSLQAANQAFYDLDLRTDEAVVSSEYATMLGHEPEGFQETHRHWLERLHPEDRDRVEAEYRAYLAGEIPEYSVEFRQRTRQGAWKWIWSLGKIVERDADGTPVRMMGTRTDIDERKRAEEERRRSEEEMRHVQKLESLGVLAGGIAHDFNNLLTSVLGNADLARHSMSPSDPARDFVENIETASQRAAELCRQMLAYAGKGRFVLEALDLSRVVDEMGHILQVSVGKNATLRYELGEDLPPVMADASQIRQVVMNLITNASDAVGAGPGVIAVTTGEVVCDRSALRSLVSGEERDAGRYVFLEVTDTGVGMDEATRERIFDPFFTTKFTGRGLGLAAALGIVRGHRGAIQLESQPGRGTTFRVLFPALAGEVPAEDDEKTRPPAAWTGRGTVLLVDDEPDVRRVATHMLRHLGFDVVEAADGQEALDRFRESPGEFVCVLLDLTMPRMGGEAAFRELRRVREDVAVLLSSGYDAQEITERFAGIGPAGFVQKPYTIASLREALQGALDGGA